MNIEVDNEILASVIDARFSIKPQLSSNIEKANFKQTIFFPEDKLKSNTFNSVPLDTYGIINKSKLFTREPITGGQISYLINDNGYTVKDSESPLVTIEHNKSIEAKGKKIIFLHPYTGGSSKTLSDEDFLKLCKSLQQ